MDMVQKYAQTITYWVLVLIAVSVVVLGYYRYKEETKFQEAGSRFTGEDAIWLLEHSNIEVIGNDIKGSSTTFRDHIRNR